MRLAVLLSLVTGCQLVFPLDGDRDPVTVTLRKTYLHDPGTTKRIELPLDPAVEPGDLLIAMIGARDLDDIEIEEISAGWTLMAEEEAVMCPGQFHVSFLSAIVTADTESQFDFDVEGSMNVLVSVYTGASSARLLDFKLMGDLQNEPTLAFPVATLEPGSIAWFGGSALKPWSVVDTPVGTERIDAVAQLAAFQLAVPDGQLPEVILPNDRPLNEFCANVAQIAVEP